MSVIPAMRTLNSINSAAPVPICKLPAVHVGDLAIRIFNSIAFQDGFDAFIECRDSIQGNVESTARVGICADIRRHDSELIMN